MGICCSSVLIESVSQSGKIDRLDFNFWNRLHREIEKSKGKVLFEFCGDLLAIEMEIN